MDRENINNNVILVCTMIALLAYVGKVCMDGGNIMDYIAIATVLLAAITSVVNLRNGNKGIDETNKEIKDIGKEIIGTTNPTIREVKTDTDVIKSKEDDIATDLKQVLDDVKARQALDNAGAGSLSRNEFISSIDKLYLKNDELIKQNAALSAEIEEARAEIEKLQRKIDRLESVSIKKTEQREYEF